MTELTLLFLLVLFCFTFGEEVQLSKKERVIKNLHENEEITSIDLSGIKWSKEELESLLRLIIQKQHVQELSLNNCNFGNLNSPELLLIFKELKQLKVLDISSNKLSKQDFEVLLRVLPELNLVSLNLADNSLNLVLPENFFSILKSLPNLRELILSYNGLGNKVNELANILGELEQLERLDLTSNNLGDQDISNLSLALGKMTNIKSLRLASNNLGRQISLLYKSLSNMKQIAHLDLFGNNFGAEGGKLLSYALIQLKNLRSLDIASNEFGYEGMSEIALSLRSLVELRTLDLSGNKIGDHGAKVLGYSLPDLKELKLLDVSWNLIGDAGGKELLKAIKSMKNLKKLRIKGNSFKIVKKEENPTPSLAGIAGELKEL